MSSSHNKRSKSSEGLLQSFQTTRISDETPSSSREPQEDTEDGYSPSNQNNDLAPRWEIGSDSSDDSSDENEMNYDLSKNPCGKCIIIDMTFKKEIQFENKVFLKYRKSSFIDASRSKRLFTWLKFVVETHQDLSKGEFLRVLKTELLKDENQRYQSFALFVLTYGQNDGLYASDGQLINIKEEIIELLSSENCKVFANKPKLVFLQASRPPVLSQIHFDSPVKHKPNPNVKDFFSADSDIFVYSSPNIEKYEWSTGGSTFIQLLCYFFEKYGHSNYLYDLVLKINGKLARVIAQENLGTDDNKMAGIYNLNTLRKKLMFSPTTIFKKADIHSTV